MPFVTLLDHRDVDNASRKRLAVGDEARFVSKGGPHHVRDAEPFTRDFPGIGFQWAFLCPVVRCNMV